MKRMKRGQDPFSEKGPDPFNFFYSAVANIGDRRGVEE
jgi:hypothetical protein